MLHIKTKFVRVSSMSPMNSMNSRRHECVVAIVILGTSLFGLSCQTTAIANDKFSDGTVEYDVVSPGEGWKEIHVENANVAWLHEASASALMVNSHCKGVEDADLQVLTRHLTIGMQDRRVLEEKSIKKSRREALETTMAASIDGVPRQMKILVLKKDGCVYDVVLSANPDRLAAALPGYERVKASFEVHQRADRR